MRKFVPDTSGAKAWRIAIHDGERYSARQIVLVGWEVWRDEEFGMCTEPVTHPIREFHEDGPREQVVIEMPGGRLFRTVGGVEFVRTHDAVFVLRAAVVLERHPGPEEYSR